MHRTEAPNASGGLHVLNTTVIGSAILNACQEELCNLLELMGVELNTQAEDNATGGRLQIYNQLTSGEWITDAAIDELTFAVMASGAINITEGYYTWEQDVGSLTFSHTSGDQNTISASRAEVQCNGAHVKYSGLGIQYSNGPEGTAAGWDTAYLRKTLVSYSPGPMTDPDGVGVWRTTLSLTTDIPYETIYSITGRAFSSAEIGGSGSWVNVPIACVVENDGGYIKIIEVRIVTGDTTNPDISSMQLLVEYNAASLTVT